MCIILKNLIQQRILPHREKEDGAGDLLLFEYSLIFLNIIEGFYEKKININFEKGKNSTFPTSSSLTNIHVFW